MKKRLLCSGGTSSTAVEREASGPPGGNKRGQPNLLSPILVILILIMAALLVYLLFGDKIADKLGGDQTEDPATEEVTPKPPVLDENDGENGSENGVDADNMGRRGGKWRF